MPANGISPLRNVSAAPIGKLKLRKAPLGLAPPSLRKFPRCLLPNASRRHRQENLHQNRRSFPPKHENRLAMLPLWNRNRLPPFVAPQALVGDVAVAAVTLQPRAGPKALRIAESRLLLLHHPFCQQSLKHQAELLIPLLKIRSLMPRHLRCAVALATQVSPHAFPSWR